MRLLTATLLFAPTLAVIGGCRIKAKVEKASRVVESCGEREFKPDDVTAGCEANGRFYRVGCFDDDEGTCVRAGETPVWAEGP